jgi:hypothetical protein
MQSTFKYKIIIKNHQQKNQKKWKQTKKLSKELVVR